MDRWLLHDDERGNSATSLLPATSGNAVRALVDGQEYFAALAEALAGADAGDLVLLAGWRVDADQLLADDGLTLGEALQQCARRGVLVKGLVWRSHPTWLGGTIYQNRRFIRAVNEAGGELVADHRVHALGSHHQKFVVLRHPGALDRDVAFVGGIDLARARGDSSRHRGDRLTRPFADDYGPSPSWHDVQVELRGPVVAEVEKVFRERWEDPSALTRLPWHTVPDRLLRLPRRPSPLPPPLPAPPAAGRCTVQLLRTYPQRRPAYPFAPRGERSVARGLSKALEQADRLVYVEDQYLWSVHVARLFARALKANPRLHVVAVAPRRPDQEGMLNVPPQLFGQAVARRIIRRAAPDRVHRFDIENEEGWPIYVHAKVTIVDDTWAAVGSSNLNRRSWTHDSELTAAVVDEDGRAEGAAGFPRELRVRLMREHLGRDVDDEEIVDLADALRTVLASAAELDAWYASDRSGPRPQGRLRTHQHSSAPPPWRRRLASWAYALVFDPDGRPVRMRLQRRY